MRKKTLELIEEIKKPKALIINGKNVSSHLEKTLIDRGCEVTKKESDSSIAGRFDYIFLFDRQEAADEIYGKNLLSNGRFILILTDEEVSQPIGIPRSFGLGTEMGTQSHFRIFRAGDLSFWSIPELVEKILKAMFSSQTLIDQRRKPKVQQVKKKEIKDRANVMLNSFQHLSKIPKQVRDDKKTIAPLVDKSKEIEIITPPLVEKKPRFSIRNIFPFLTLILFLIFLFLGSITFWYASKIKKTLTSLQYHVASTNISGLTSDIKEVKQEIQTAKNIYNYSSTILFPFKNTSFFKDTGTIINTAENLAGSGEEFVYSVKEIIPSQTGFATVNTISVEQLKNFEKKLAIFATDLLTAKEKFQKVSLSFLPKEKINTTLSPIISQLSYVYEVTPMVEKIFFPDQPKVYLVLLQNNMELRPTGGFIGSFGLLTIDNGKISDFKIQDVYEADGQLKGHVDPPLPIRKYLGQPHFFLRDSNFDPDFAASAATASFFLQKELGKNVDGVMAINLPLAQKILKQVGSIKLADFNNEEITSDNFFQKAHFYSQNNFFPGSTQKKDILTAVTNEILAKLTGASKTNYLSLFSLLRQALEEKNILLYSTDEGLQKEIQDHGWAGRLVKVSCVERKNTNNTNTNSDKCFPDYLSLSEANLGVNKANYSINKSTVVEKKIDSEGKITTDVTIAYENQESTILDQSQTYVNYLRFFIPKESKLVSVTLNNAPINSSDVDTENYSDDKTSFGFLVKIAPGNKGVVKISFVLPSSITSADSYQFFFQKQGGDKNSPLIFSLTYPTNLKLTPVNFTSTSNRDGEIFYTTDNSVDRVFALSKE